MVTLKTNCQTCGLLVATEAPEPERRSLLDDLGLGALRDWFRPAPGPRPYAEPSDSPAEDAHEDAPQPEAEPGEQGAWEGESALASDGRVAETDREPALVLPVSTDAPSEDASDRYTEPRWVLVPDKAEEERGAAPVAGDTDSRLATAPLDLGAGDTEDQSVLPPETKRAAESQDPDPGSEAGRSGSR
jgi:hypothetical protein